MSKARALLDSLDDDGGYNDVACPACGGPGIPLGGLGRRMHFRCRDCGNTFSEEQTPESRETEHAGGWGNFSGESIDKPKDVSCAPTRNKQVKHVDAGKGKKKHALNVRAPQPRQ